MENNQSPDMVKFSSVLSVITDNPTAFKSEGEMARILRQINCLQKYDLKPVADNITNNNITVNLVTEHPKVKQLIEKIKDNI